jgi:hypothetical protein
MPMPLPQPLAVLAVGDPDSELDEEARNAIAESILHSLQNDPSAQEAWELARMASGDEAEERTVLDLTIDDIRGFCRDIFQAVQEGKLPDPRQMQPSLPFGMEETDQELFQEIAKEIPKRLVEGDFLDSHDRPEADFYVLLTSMLHHAAGVIESDGPEKAILARASLIAMKMFVATVRQRRDPRNFGPADADS